MNPQPQLNYAEAKNVLNSLAVYIKQKMELANNQTNTQTPMNLASQPVIESDHLMEETPLSPVTETVAAPVVTAPVVENTQVVESPVLDSVTPAPQVIVPEVPEVAPVTPVAPVTNVAEVPVQESPVVSSPVQAPVLNPLENVQMPQVIEPPVLDTPSVPLVEPENNGYKAINNTSTVGYAEPTQVPEPPVVMPVGDAINNANDSLVVGPEAFNMSR